jgi:hypothetical protein
MAKNGYVSSSKHTKHIKAKYFFIRHFHNSGELDLQYCPTEQMWADILIKPFQGAKFCFMRAFLMNCPIDYSEVLLMAPTRPVPTLVPTSLSTSKLAKPFIPSLAPTNLPMKPRFLQPKPPSRECVETKSHGTKYQVQAVNQYSGSTNPKRRMSAGRMPYFHVIPLSLAPDLYRV